MTAISYPMDYRTIIAAFCVLFGLAIVCTMVTNKIFKIIDRDDQDRKKK